MGPLDSPVEIAIKMFVCIPSFYWVHALCLCKKGLVYLYIWYEQITVIFSTFLNISLAYWQFPS